MEIKLIMIYLLSVDHLLSFPSKAHMWSSGPQASCSSTNLKIEESLLASLFTFSLISIYDAVRYEQMEQNKLKEPVTSSNQG